MEKRYYWLKFRSDFFDSKRIKKLRNMAGGDTYCIIYLKMQLKALNSGGYLEFTGIEDEFADELALDLDERPDDVKVTLLFLLQYGLCECSDNIHYYLPWVAENSGSETASTQRSRECRKRKALQGAQQEQSYTAAQIACRAKQSCEEKQHIPMIDDHTNQKRYSGNYYLVCQRERYRCAMCDSTENLCVHHIDGFSEDKPENNALNKMILLCRKCHSNVHAGRLIPQDLLDAIGYGCDSDESCNTDATEVQRMCSVEKEKEIDKSREEKKRFVPPTLDEVKARCKEKGYTLDPEAFMSYYNANGWKVGRTKMVSWVDALAGWESREKQYRKPKKQNAALKYQQTEISKQDWDAMVVSFDD